MCRVSRCSGTLVEKTACIMDESRTTSLTCRPQPAQGDVSAMTIAWSRWAAAPGAILIAAKNATKTTKRGGNRFIAHSFLVKKVERKTRQGAANVPKRSAWKAMRLKVVRSNAAILRLV